MKHVTVIQHNSAEWLGHIEDHFEGRGIRYSYFRPFATGGRVPDLKLLGDGLILLGAGPWGGVAGERQLPTFAEEVKLARACLMTNVPVLGFGLGASIIAAAGDGGIEAAPLSARIDEATATDREALSGFLPERFPIAVYRRDKTVVPDYATILARDRSGAPAAFALGPRAYGFEGHPGVRRAMFEDLVMEFEDAPEGVGEVLEEFGAVSKAMEDALVPLMAGLVRALGWQAVA